MLKEIYKTNFNIFYLLLKERPALLELELILHVFFSSSGKQNVIFYGKTAEANHILFSKMEHIIINIYIHSSIMKRQSQIAILIGTKQGIFI